MECLSNFFFYFFFSQGVNFVDDPLLVNVSGIFLFHLILSFFWIHETMTDWDASISFTFSLESRDHAYSPPWVHFSLSLHHSFLSSLLCCSPSPTPNITAKWIGMPHFHIMNWLCVIPGLNSHWLPPTLSPSCFRALLDFMASCQLLCTNHCPTSHGTLNGCPTIVQPVSDETLEVTKSMLAKETLQISISEWVWCSPIDTPSHGASIDRTFTFTCKELLAHPEWLTCL